jgi:hypothetical protein
MPQLPGQGVVLDFLASKINTAGLIGWRSNK